MNIQIKNKKLARRKKSVRKNVFGTSTMPRVSVYRSNVHIFVQIVDDERGVTLIGMGDKRVRTSAKATKSDLAKQLGTLVGEEAKKLKIEKVVFDRNGYKYHGRVKALAEGLREAGLLF